MHGRRVPHPRPGERAVILARGVMGHMVLPLGVPPLNAGMLPPVLLDGRKMIQRHDVPRADWPALAVSG